MSSSASVTVERASQEFAYALIARIALTAGGYSLHPDKNNPKSYGVMSRPENYQDYYRIAKEYTNLVISSGSHSIGTSYKDVFLEISRVLPLQPMKDRHLVRTYGEQPTETAD